VRIVKTIGDAVMFAARDPVAVCAAATSLVDAADGEALPALHVGLAHGPVLPRHADYFGRTVNVASRLCSAAPQGTVWLAWPVAGVSREHLEGAGLRVGEPQTPTLKGLGDSVQAVAVSAASA
jgi:adenylate cyclase